MNSEFIKHLPTLQPDSRVRSSLPLLLQRSTHRNLLIQFALRDGKFISVPRMPMPLQSSQKIMTLTTDKSGLMRSLNQSLKTCSGNPLILMQAIKTGIDMLPVGSYIFGSATAGLNLSRRDPNVLARNGDEIWHFEAVGKVYRKNYFTKGGDWVVNHISSYFLYDPFRANKNPEKGWLIHESRTNIVFE